MLVTRRNTGRAHGAKLFGDWHKPVHMRSRTSSWLPPVGETDVSSRSLYVHDEIRLSSDSEHEEQSRHCGARYRLNCFGSSLPPDWMLDAASHQKVLCPTWLGLSDIHPLSTWEDCRTANAGG